MKRRTLALAVLALLVAATGCFNPFRPRVAPDGGIPEEPPEPTSATGVLELFEWCWDNRNLQVYRELFTDDFRFWFALGDSAGNDFRDRGTNREEELIIAENLFVGGGDSERPPANRITLEWLEPLREVDDSRAGKHPGWHKEIVTKFRLDVETDEETYVVTGLSRFFMVRGDSALLPQELIDAGFTQDPNRWFIEEWRDETQVDPVVMLAPGAGSLAAAPAGTGLEASPAWRARRALPGRGVERAGADWVDVTLGQLKSIWR